MHTKNINRRTSSVPDSSGQRLLSQSQPSHSEFSSDTYCSLRRTVKSNAAADSMTPDLQRGSFQRKFRSLWFGSSGKKKENKDQLETSSRVKSLSSPSLTAAIRENTCHILPSATSDFAIASVASICGEDCQCNQVCPCCIEDQQQEMDYLQRNITAMGNNNNNSISATSRMTSHTLPRNFTVCIPDSPPPHTDVEDKYVFVVSDLDTSHPQLSVRTEQQIEHVTQISPPSSSEGEVAVRRGNERNNRSDDPDRSLASVIPDRMGSAESQDYLYKSSSASESGRGTLPSETERLLKKPPESEQPQEPQYTSVNKKSTRTTVSGKETDYHRSKYPQLYVAATRAPMPAVIESESWVSDCSTFREVVRPSRESQQQQHLSIVKVKKSDPAKGSSMKGKPPKPMSHSRSEVRMSHWKSADSVSCADDVTSEFTADVSCTYNQQDTGLRQDLRSLQIMYDKVFKRLSHANVRNNRRRSMGSISTINSLSIHRATDSRRITSARKKPPLEDSSTSKKIRKIEENVITLAKSVSSLTSESRQTGKLHDQVACLMKEVTCLQQQMNHLQLHLDAQTGRNKTESSEKIYSSVKKQSKISRLFTEEVTPLRVFLKKLGYERYCCLFDEERIRMEELMLMSEEKLQKLGIPMGPRTRIIEEIYKSRSVNRNRHH